MNAQQRRKAYRTIDRMVGKTMLFVSNRGHAVPVTVLGRTDPVEKTSMSAFFGYNFDGSRPSVHRAHCQRADRTDGSTFSPRLRQLRAA